MITGTEQHGMLLNDLRKVKLVLRRAVFEEALCYKIPIGVHAKVFGILQDQLDHRLELLLAAMLNQALYDATANRVPGKLPSTGFNLIDYELPSLRAQGEDELLEDKICIVALGGLHDIVLELLNQHLPLVTAGAVDNFLQPLGTVLRRSGHVQHTPLDRSHRILH
jgi:hypothetical protein